MQSAKDCRIIDSGEEDPGSGCDAAKHKTEESDGSVAKKGFGVACGGLRCGVSRVDLGDFGWEVINLNACFSVS